MGKTATPSFTTATKPADPDDLTDVDSAGEEATAPDPEAATDPETEWVELPWVPVLRNPRVAAATVVGGVLTAAAVGLSGGGFGSITTTLQIGLAALLVLLAVIDAVIQRLPDTLVLPAYVLAVLGTAGAAATGEITWHHALVAASCMAGLWVLFYTIAFFTGGMGFGDVKLAGLIGLVLGTQGIGNAIAGSFLFPSLCAAPVLIVLLIRGLNRKSGIPFGPLLAAGAVLALIFHQSVSDMYTVLSWQF